MLRDNTRYVVLGPKIVGMLEADLPSGDDLSSENSSPEDLLSFPVTVKQYQHSSLETNFLLVRKQSSKKNPEFFGS